MDSKLTKEALDNKPMSLPADDIESHWTKERMENTIPYPLTVHEYHEGGDAYAKIRLVEDPGQSGTAVNLAV